MARVVKKKIVTKSIPKKRAPKKKSTKKKDEIVIEPFMVAGKLTPQAELFCRLYATSTDHFSNATWAYAEAFGYDLFALSDDPVTKKDKKGKEIVIDLSPREKAYRVCKTLGSRLLTKVDINDRINFYLLQQANEQVADRELAWVIAQRKELGPKVRAIGELNKLKQRIQERVIVEVEEKDKSNSDSILSRFIKKNGKRNT